MSKLLNDYKSFRAALSDLEAVYGSDLLNAANSKVEIVYTDDVVYAIEMYRTGKIAKTELVDWVNTLWFCNALYDYADEQCDSIASVMNELETLDEDGACYTDGDFERMIAALKRNQEYAHGSSAN